MYTVHYGWKGCPVRAQHFRTQEDCATFIRELRLQAPLAWTRIVSPDAS